MDKNFFHVSDNFLEAEYREGYYVSEKMKKIFDMNISEIPTDEMLIIMDKIKSDENSWIG